MGRTPTTLPCAANRIVIGRPYMLLRHHLSDQTGFRYATANGGWRSLVLVHPQQAQSFVRKLSGYTLSLQLATKKEGVRRHSEPPLADDMGLPQSKGPQIHH